MPLPGPEIRFGIQPMGVNKLEPIIKTICAEKGFVGNFLNHLGKRTCATTLFQYGKLYDSSDKSIKIICVL